jgi:SAM-dependent methyltransferase
VHVIGELYEDALAGSAPGDESILDRCAGPTLDIGSGPGRLTLALAERGIPTLGIDITPHAVGLARSCGALVMLRDVFDRVPGTGRWATILLADGSIGIGGDPTALLRRVGELLAPDGRALVELDPPGQPLRHERVRLHHDGTDSTWCPWARVGADHIATLAADAGLGSVETWSASDRWFAAISQNDARFP